MKSEPRRTLVASIALTMLLAGLTSRANAESPTANNLVSNPSFERSEPAKLPAGWHGDPSVYASDAEQHHSGTSSLRYVNTDTNRYRLCSQEVPVRGLEVPFRRVDQDKRYSRRRVRCYYLRGMARRPRQVVGRQLSARDQGDARLDSHGRSHADSGRCRHSHPGLLCASGHDRHGLVRRRGTCANHRSADAGHHAVAGVSRLDYVARPGLCPGARAARSARL